MADREKLAEYLETCMRNRVISESFSEVIISLTKAEEIFALLKEQEAVVRCKDCKRRGTYDCPVYVGGDGMSSEPDDWFCADGERK